VDMTLFVIGNSSQALRPIADSSYADFRSGSRSCVRPFCGALWRTGPEGRAAAPAGQRTQGKFWALHVLLGAGRWEGRKVYTWRT
jgi:hypothetical protein